MKSVRLAAVFACLTVVGSTVASTPSTAAASDLASGASQPVAGPMRTVPIYRPGHTDTDTVATSCPTLQVCHDLVLQTAATTVVVAETRSAGGISSAVIPAPAGSGPKFTGRYRDLSCPTATWCAAVGLGFDPPAYYPSAIAAVLTPGTWSAQRLPSPPGADSWDVKDVSCWAPGSCVAVGAAYFGAGSHAWMAELVAGSWVSTETGLGDSSELDRVSCTQGGCTAIGNASDAPFAITRTDGSDTWTRASIPLTSASSVPDWTGLGCARPERCVAVADLQGSTAVVKSVAGAWSTTALAADWPSPGGVDCPAAGHCVIVGSSPDGQAALVQDGRTWTQQQLPVDTVQAEVYSGVSCARIGACSAVGYGLYSSRSKSVVATLVDGTWTGGRVDLPLPPRATLTGVACISSSDCRAIGDSYSERAQEVWAAQRSGDSWFYPATQPSSDYTFTAGVDCPATDECVATAVDTSVVGGRSEVLQYSGGVWSTAVRPLPLHQTEPYVTAPSCPAAGSCMFGVSYQDSAGHWHLLAERLISGDWAVTEMPLPEGRPAITIDAVSCATTSWCAAVGGDAEGMFAEVYASGRWQVRPLPTLGPWSAPALVSLDCPQVGACRAVGTTDATSDSGQPLTARFADDSWTVRARPLGSDTSGSALTAVSCARPGQCAAVGRRIDSSTGLSQPVVAVLRTHGWARYRPALPSGIYSAELSALDCVATTCRAVGQGLSHDGGQYPVSAPVRLG